MTNGRSLAAALLLLASTAYTATVTFDCSKVPNICSNDCYAIKCQGKPSSLHRDSNDASAHRDANACRSPNRCSGNPDTSNSCDEYPYASSQEGGAGAITRCVPAHENSVQGGTLSSFYTRNSIGNGDQYDVAFTGSSGLQYCSGSCTNSGNELIRRSSEYQSRDASLYNERHFVTEEGHDLLMFEARSAPGSLDDKVGSSTFLAHEDRFVTITQAV